MTWAQRLLTLARGDAAGQPFADLARFHAGFLVRSARLAGHALQAPTEAAEVDLRDLAATEAELANRLMQILAERQIAVPAAAVAATPAASENHWARLVQDLDAHREARSQLLEAASRINELDAELAARLEELSRAEESQLLRLRAMIARADPQASN